MAARQRGIKKSEFTGSDTIADSSTFDFVTTAGENIKITKAQLLAALGVTGTLSQEGDPVATPVLDPQGSNNGIRNLENGPGAKASVSPQNGITLEHNFQAGSGGVPVLTDIGEASPIVGNAIPGQGMSVAAVPGGFQIALSATPVATQTVIINTMADFPNPVLGVRTLVAGTDYFITNNLTTSDRFDVSAGDILVRASDSSIVTFTYTGTGDFFTGVNATFRLGRITLVALTGRCWNMSDDSGTAFFQFIDGSIRGCDKVGLITGTALGFGAVQVNNVGIFGAITDGMEFSGTIGACLGLTNIATILAGAVYNLGTATFGSFNVDDCLIDLQGGGTTFISGAAASANILAGGLGTVVNTRIRGAGTPLSGITPDDDLWDFLLNDDIRDSRTDGLLSLQGNAVNTVIVGASTDGSNAVLVAGAWTVVGTARMTGTAAGRLTHTGAKAARLPVTGSVTVAPVSGGTIQINAYFAFNGVVDVASRRSGSAASGSPTSITLPWQETYDPTQFTEIFVENTGSAVDLLVSSAIHRAN